MEYYHLMFSIHVVFDIVFVIIISGMNSVIEKGMLYGALSWEFCLFVLLLIYFLLSSFLG